MKLDDKAIGRAANAQFARFDLRDGQDGERVVVCKKSLFTWAVHFLRYQFSSGYRHEVHEVRREILAELCGQAHPDENSTSDGQNGLIGNRRRFNAYLVSHVTSSNASEIEQPATTASGEEEKLQTTGVPDTVSGDEGAGPVGAKVVEVADRTWPAGDSVYASFWEKKGPDIVEQQYRNIIQFENRLDSIDAPDLALKRSVYTGDVRVSGKEALCKQISINLGIGIKKARTDPACKSGSDINCILSYLLLVAPKNEHNDLFSRSVSVKPIGAKDTDLNRHLGNWGLENAPVRYDVATCRLPGNKLSILVDGLLKEHFQAGKNQEEILSGLDEELRQARNPVHRGKYDVVNPVHGNLTEDEFTFCVTEMKNFAKLLFE